MKALLSPSSVSSAATACGMVEAGKTVEGRRPGLCRRRSQFMVCRPMGD